MTNSPRIDTMKTMAWASVWTSWRSVLSSVLPSHSADGLKVWVFSKVPTKHVNVTVCQALCFKFGLRVRWMWAKMVLVQQSRQSRAGSANSGPPLSRSRLARSWLPPGRPHGAGAAIAAGQCFVACLARAAWLRVAADALRCERQIRSESRIQIVLHCAACGRRAGSYLQMSPGLTDTLAPWHHCLVFAFREPTLGLGQISLGLGKD